MTNNFYCAMLRKMFVIKARKDKVRKLNLRRVNPSIILRVNTERSRSINPLSEQVRKILGGVDQRLIVMVRG